MFGIRRLLRTAAVVAFVASVALVVVPALDRTLRERVTEAIAQAKAELENQLGLTISFESLSPSILHSFAFSSMTLRNPQGQVFLEARTVRVYYDIFAILRGEPNNALKTITLDDAAADVVLPRDNALLARLSPYIFPPPGMPAPKFKLVGRALFLHVEDEGLGSLALSARDFTYSNLGATTDLSLSGGFTLMPARGSIGSIEGPLEVSGSLSQDLSMARAQIAVAGRAPNFSFAMQRFELVYTKGVVELRKVRDKAPLDMSLTFDPHDGNVSAFLRMDGFVPERSVHLYGSLAAFSPWMRAPYDGSLSFDIPSGDIARAHYSLHLDTSLPESVLHSPYRASIAAAGDLRQARIDYLRLGNSSRSIEYRGSFDFSDLSPDGSLNMAISLREGRLPIAATFRLYGHGGIYTALAERVDAAGAVFRDLSIAAAYKGDSLEFQASIRPPEVEGEPSALPSRHFASEGGVAYGAFPRISIEGSASLGANPVLDVSASLEELDLKPLQNLLALALDSPQTAAALGDLKLGGELFATSDFSRLSWSASDLAVVSRSVPGAYALLSLSGNLQSLSVRRLILSAAGYSVEGTGSVEFAGTGRLGFDANLTLQDIPYHLRGTLVGQGLFITGDYGLNIGARAEEGGTFFNATAKAFPFPLAGGVALATLDADGRFASLSDWSVALNKLDLAPADDRTSKLPHLSLSGVLGPTSARLGMVKVEDRYSRLSGSIALEYALGGSPSLRVKASLSAATTSTAKQTQGGEAVALPEAAVREQYSLDLDYGKGLLSGNLDFKASPLSRLGFEGLVGSLDGRLGIHGTLSDPHLDFDAALRNGMIGIEPMTLSLKGGFSGKTFHVDAMSARYLRQSIRSGSFSYSFADSSAKFRIDFQGDWGDRPVILTFEADGSSILSGTAPEVRAADATAASASASGAAPRPAESAQGFALLRNLPVALRNYHLSGLVWNFTVGTAKVESWPFDLSITPQLVRFSGGTGSDLVAAFQSTGQFSIRSSSALPVALSASGKLAGDSVDARIDDIDVNLAALSPALPIATTKFYAGSIRGSLLVKGLIADPDITGTLGMESVVVSVPEWLSTKVGPFSAPVSVLGKSVAFSASDVPAGKARLDVRATADLDHWAPSNFKAFVSTGNGSPLDIDLGISGVLVKGQANFDLSVELRSDVLALTGTVTLQRSSVIISPEVLGGGEKESVVRPPIPFSYRRGSTSEEESRFSSPRGIFRWYPVMPIPPAS